MNTTVNKTVENKRLKTTISVHVINERHLILDLKDKRIIGNIQSFKTEKVTDSIAEDGVLRPALISQFIIENVDMAKVEETIEKYVNDNIETIVSA